MPSVVPVSEMQKHGAELVDQAMETKEPIYLTRRGYKTVVLIDAEEYERLARSEYDRVKNALWTKDMIERGHTDVNEGRTVTLDDALAMLEERWDAR